MLITTRRRRVPLSCSLAVVAALGLAACAGSDDEDGDAGFDEEFVDEDFDDEGEFDEDFDEGGFDDEGEFDEGGFDDEEFADEGEFDEEFADEEFDDDGSGGDEPEEEVGGDTAPAPGGGVGPTSGLAPGELQDVLAELQEAGFCDPVDVESDGTVTSMHFVADGSVQPACYTDEGGDDPRLLEAWSVITDIAPVSLYDDVSLLAGYEGATDTLAFVTTLDEAASFFLMAVDVTAGENDPDELRLTMLHELTHVFAQHPGDQLDVSVQDPADCDTFFNGSGCFIDGAYIDRWVEQFWTDEMVAALPDDGSPLGDDESYELCVAEGGGFTGAYAATHPEEDFAESFSAYVFDVELPADLDDKLAFFDGYPEFVAVRDAARELGVSGLPGAFDLCQ